ncbi:MAG TPA: HAMP domain-containing sensor histidine kinase [Candidatus Sulfotelmatobacter sp.]|nr:HAMP domain-containing sensor histidine kinase [Candidatus Sulfotelmatobacter sp.]
MFDDQVLHDLKNPLSGITGSIGLFLEGLLGPLDAEQKKYLTNIDFSAKRLTLLLMELSAVANAEKKQLVVTKVPFPAGELREETAWLKQLAALENKTIVDTFDDDLSLPADKKLTVMIVTDLLLNACKQTDRGGRVTFSIKPDKGGPLFEIGFSGEGIPREFTAKIFDKNFRADHPELKAKTGAGLGLYFCKLAVEAQGGKIGAEGARFHFRLPQDR